MFEGIIQDNDSQPVVPHLVIAFKKQSKTLVVIFSLKTVSTEFQGKTPQENLLP